MSVVRRLATLTAGVSVVFALGASPAWSHPLGNFTVNRHLAVVVGPGRLSARYVVDRAEIPTFQLHDTIDTDADGDVTDAELARFATSDCEQHARGVNLKIDGRSRAFEVVRGVAGYEPGQAGLETMRLTCDLSTDRVPDAAAVKLRDDNDPDRIGWREITVAGDRATITSSDVAAESVSSELREYPDDRLESPLDVRTATFEYREGGEALVGARDPSSNPLTARYEGFTSWFTRSVEARRLTVGLALVALAAALVLGAFHVVAPGHGKTVMAAYLVGERGNVANAVTLGLTVAITHTVGVLALGTVLTASQAFAPESVYPWLGVASGICFVALGMSIAVRAMRSRGRGVHGHSHGGHIHHDHDHGRDHDAPAHRLGVHRHDTRAHDRPAVRTRELLTLGFAGGMVPTPSALIVLLGATAIGRAWFGALLVVAYGIGMSATLVAAGLALAWARQRFELRVATDRAMKLATVLPVVTGIVVTLGGLSLIARSV